MLLFLWSLEDVEKVVWFADLFRSRENPKDFGLLLSSFLGGGGGLLSSANVVTFVCCEVLIWSVIIIVKCKLKQLNQKLFYTI